MPPLFHFTPERRERFQRIALATIVVLLATIATNRLVHAVQPAFSGDRVAQAHTHEAWHWDDDCAPSRDHVHHEVAAVAREVADEARRMADEARRVAEEHRRVVREHRHHGEERCRVEREIERAVETELAVVVR